MSSLIEAENIHKTYQLGRHVIPVLAGAALRVVAGQTVSIVGLSGAGKSTLLHVLGGLDQPDQGRVMVEDRDLYRLSARQRALVRALKIGFVFQSYHLFPEMDVLENVMLPCMAAPQSWTAARQNRERARDLLAAVGLDGRMNHTPLELSGGEQQRVAIARALMNDPALILADEPTGNLDDETGRQVLDYLFQLVRDGRHTLIIVTHHEKVAAACDQCYRLGGGKLVPASA